MNHYAPRRREDTGKWDYTVRNDDFIWPVGYCAGYREWKPEDFPWFRHSPEAQIREAAESNRRESPFKDKYHTHGHDTPEEARACYKEYQLDLRLRFFDDVSNAPALHLCQKKGCDRYTSGLAEIGSYQHFRLCATHRTRADVAEILTVGTSWSS